MKRWLGIVLIILSLQFVGCKEKNPSETPYTGPTHRTFFLYVAANNNLSGEADINLEAIRKSATKLMLRENKIVIFHASPSGTPKLLELQYGASSSGNSYKVLKEYPNQAASNWKVYSQAIDDMKTFASAETYGLVLWSHANGWLSDSTPKKYIALDGSLNRMLRPEESFVRDPFRAMVELPEEAVPTKIFGQDLALGGGWMELSDLAEATLADTFDFIICDCCLMGDVEVVYAFRNKCKYLIASPAEVVSTGFPYNKILGNVFASGDLLGRLKNICQIYNDHYTGTTISTTWNSATIALYDSSEMDNFATVMSRIFYQERAKISNFNVRSVQSYDRYTLHTKLDATDVVYSLLDANDPLRTEYDSQIAKTVLYKATTGRMINLFITSYSGIGVYLPIDAYADLNTSYYKTAWGKEVFNFQ